MDPFSIKRDLKPSHASTNSLSCMYVCMCVFSIDSGPLSRMCQEYGLLPFPYNTLVGWRGDREPGPSSS